MVICWFYNQSLLILCLNDKSKKKGGYYCLSGYHEHRLPHSSLVLFICSNLRPKPAHRGQPITGLLFSHHTSMTQTCRFPHSPWIYVDAAAVSRSILILTCVISISL